MPENCSQLLDQIRKLRNLRYELRTILESLKRLRDHHDILQGPIFNSVIENLGIKIAAIERELAGLVLKAWDSGCLEWREVEA